MIVLGAGCPGRTSLGIFLPIPPHCQVSPFTSLGGGWGAHSSPPVVLRPPQDLLCLPVWAERVDAWIFPHVSTYRTSGASSPPQKRSIHSPSRPNLIWKSGLCK